jgi:hypothetical protein
MTVLAEHVIKQLIQIEAGVHYCELPPPEHNPFVLIERESPIILSAPHGAITFRNDGDEIWHDEDEYTAGIALLLSEICKTSVIATVWRTADSDPNHSPKDKSGYKRALGEILATGKLRWVIDLHGAKEKNDRLADTQKIDLGAGKNNEYLPADAYKTLVQSIEMYLGPGTADRNGYKGFSATEAGRIAAFAHSFEKVWSMQLEMKPSVRVPLRRVDASMYGKNPNQGGGPYSAPPHKVLGNLQAIVDFINYLKSMKEP